MNEGDAARLDAEFAAQTALLESDSVDDFKKKHVESHTLRKYTTEKGLSGHQHEAMLDAAGNGTTCSEHGHSHVFMGWHSSEGPDGHTHWIAPQDRRAKAANAPSGVLNKEGPMAMREGYHGGRKLLSKERAADIKRKLKTMDERCDKNKKVMRNLKRRKGLQRETFDKRKSIEEVGTFDGHLRLNVPGDGSGKSRGRKLKTDPTKPARLLPAKRQRKPRE